LVSMSPPPAAALLLLSFPLAEAWTTPFLRPMMSRTVARSSLANANAAMDPFASAIFNTAQTVSQPAAAQTGSVDLLSLAVSYVGLMLLLTGWEYHVLPKLQDAGLMPELPKGTGSIHALRKAKEEIFAVPWATPITVDRTVQLPTLEELQADACRVGVSVTDSGIRVAQYIRAHAQDAAAEAGSKVLMELAASEEQSAPRLVPIKARFEDGMSISDELGVCQLSEDFSKFYNHKVYICKRKQ